MPRLPGLLRTMAAFGEVDGVEFAVQSDAQRRVQARTTVQTPELFLGANPAPGGLYDARMGTTDMGYSCTTCGRTSRLCPGHSGLIVLKAAVLLPYAVAETRRWLRVVCLHCGALMVDPDNARIRAAPAAKKLAAAASAGDPQGHPCPVCHKLHWGVVKSPDDNFSFLLEPPAADRRAGRKGRSEKRAVLLLPFQIARIFSRVSDEAVAALGRDPQKAHPRMLVMVDALQVPAVSIRPAIRMAGPRASSHHDINSMLQYIVKANANVFVGSGLSALPAAGEPTPKELAQSMLMLQQLVFDLLQGTGAAAAQKRTQKRGIVMGARAFESVARRWPSKFGRIRRHLLGGRTFAIARNTISGVSALPIHEVAIPESFARALQVEVVIHPENVAQNMRYFLNGRRQYPGATRVWRAATQTTHDVEGLRSDFQLEPGDALWRDVVTGDLALFNRQPSLERSAINTHRVRVIREPFAGSRFRKPPVRKTIAFNVLGTPFYNADFDGDEMNLFVMAQPGPRAEARVLGTLAQGFISTKDSKPVIGQVQDSTVGSMLLSVAPALDKLHAMRLFETCGTSAAAPDFSDLRPEDTVDGREALSRLLRQWPVTLARRPAWYAEPAVPYVAYPADQTETVVRAGALLSGVLDKATVGGGAGGGIFHRISRTYGAQSALDAVFALQQMTLRYLDGRGFTLGLGDMAMPAEKVAQVHEIIAGMLREAQAINDKLLKGEIVPPLGMTTHDYYEQLLIEALKVPDDALGPVLARIDPATNGLYQMIATGSKANFKNLLNISSLVGQITINGRRIETTTGRTLAYYQRGDPSPAASGFIVNNYVCGLTAAEHYFGAMNGRNDLTNKALSTASTGWANRKAVMSAQSAVVDSLRLVCAGANLVEPLYGEDGMDAREIEPIRYVLAELGDAEVRERFLAPAAAALEGTPAWLEAEVARLFADRDEFREVALAVEQANFGFSLHDKVLMAVDVRTIAQAVSIDAYPEGEVPATPAGELEALQTAVGEFCGRLPYLLLNARQEAAKAAVPAPFAVAFDHLGRSVRAELATVRIRALGLTAGLLQQVFDTIRLRVIRSLVAPGEAVGIQAAQAVSEPFTQYMLDSHHRSVKGGTSKAGIVRPAEIMGAQPVEKEKTSQMFFRGLAAGGGAVTNDRALLQELADSVKQLTLAQLVSEWQLLYEPLPAREELRAGTPAAEREEGAFYPDYAPGGPANDWGWMLEYLESNPLLGQLTPDDQVTDWCARFDVDRLQLVMKGISLETVVNTLRVAFPTVYILHTNEAATGATPRIVIRMYLTGASFRSRGGRKGGGGCEEKVAGEVFEEVLGHAIRGIQGIVDARVEKTLRHYVVPAMGADGKPNPDAGRLAVEKGAAGIRTTGTNIHGALLHERVAPDTVVSSSIGDTIKMFGIEAGRNKIIMELRRALGSRAPNVRHMALFADIMTHTGVHTPFEVTGITQREPDNVFLRAAAHGPIPVLTEAALQGTFNPNYGMTTPQVLGAVPKLGSASCKLAVDAEFVAANVQSVAQLVMDI